MENLKALTLPELKEFLTFELLLTLKFVNETKTKEDCVQAYNKLTGTIGTALKKCLVPEKLDKLYKTCPEIEDIDKFLETVLPPRFQLNKENEVELNDELMSQSNGDTQFYDCLSETEVTPKKVMPLKEDLDTAANSPEQSRPPSAKAMLKTSVNFQVLLQNAAAQRQQEMETCETEQ